MAPQHRGVKAGAQIPYSRGPVIEAGNDQLSIGTKSDRVDTVRMSFQYDRRILAISVPQACSVVRRCGHHHPFLAASHCEFGTFGSMLTQNRNRIVETSI